jgi:hypothetical protein
VLDHRNRGGLAVAIEDDRRLARVLEKAEAEDARAHAQQVEVDERERDRRSEGKRAPGLQRAPAREAFEAHAHHEERHGHVDEGTEPGEVLHPEMLHADVRREDGADDAPGRVGAVDPPDRRLAVPAPSERVVASGASFPRRTRSGT